MELKDVASVFGKSGLHKIIGKGASGLVLESIDEFKKRTITPLSQKVSILEDVSVFLNDGDVKLHDVFAKMQEMSKENNLSSISKNSSADEIKKWFASIVPDFDREKVYNSDIIKISNWFSILNNFIDFSVKQSEENAEQSSETDKTKHKTIKPIKKVEAKAKTKTSKGAAKTTITSRKMS
ncbi:MAG: DUF5606 domain-containing protein [Bacteroidetes bacterium]|nr:DUF5606 domain-containing protein [Bacteroidota bacterium]